MSAPTRLTNDEVKDLCRRIADGDTAARNALVMANMGLVRMVAREQSSDPTQFQDLVQQGALGLIRATETFDPTREKFSTYSVHWIRSFIQRWQRHRRREEIPFVMTAAKVVDDKGRRRRPRSAAVSLSAPVGEEDATLGDGIPSDLESPEDFVIRKQREEAVGEAMTKACGTLDPRRRAIIEQRTLSDDPVGLAQLSAELGVSREWVRILEHKVVKKASYHLGAHA